jgi:acyl-CoA synthetase (AMP-forming)/AMP-acid ligase II
MNRQTKLQKMLDVGITNYPDKTAIRFDGRKISYLQLQQLCRKLATGFVDNNITAGDRVALFLPNCPEAVMAFLACYRIGAIAVPLNYRYLTEEAQYVIEQTGAKLIIFHQTRSEIVHSLRGLFDPTGMYVLNDSSSDIEYRSVMPADCRPSLCLLCQSAARLSWT